MAFLEVNCFSKSLDQNVQVNVILPERSAAQKGSGAPEGTYKTLWLLHGLSGNHMDWMRRTGIERYAAKYNLAVVMPGVGRSWYSDTAYGAKYFTFVTEELPEICRSYFKNMSDKREDNLIAGLSMGGYGALKAALSCPQTYGFCAALSGSLDITRKGRKYDLEEWRGNFGYDMKSALELEGGSNDVFALTQKNQEGGIAFPKLYLWCGTEDGLIEVNRRYSEYLKELGIDHLFEESQGDHSWIWWDLHIQSALQYLLG